jgi:error-prone DNA polymerase
MAFNNPPVPWKRLERTLSGEPRTPEGSALWQRPAPDGGDGPGWSRHRGAYQTPALVRPASVVPYAELHAHTSFSHLDGASTPEEMAEEAARLGLSALAVTDHDGMYGLPRFAAAAAGQGVPTIIGAELALDARIPATRSAGLTGARAAVPDPPGRHLLVIARDPTGYASLCRAISNAHRRGGAKGHPVHDLDELTALAGGHWLVLTGCRKGPVRSVLGADSKDLAPARSALAELVERFGHDHVAVELTYAREALADERFDALALLAQEAGLPTVATTAAHYHSPERRRLATVLAAVRARRSLDELDGWLPGWADAHLRSGQEMARRFARWPGAVDRAAAFGAEVTFDLKLVAPNLPPFDIPPGFADEMAYLRHLTFTGAAERFPQGVTDAVRKRLEHELKVIEQRNFPGYFLVVWEITEFCRANGILVQGRGSAAGSAVCYALRVTAIDPIGYDLLFERFLAPDRTEPPDIDLDIESGDPREKVIQFVYAKHGRDYAAQVANSVVYRPKNAVRDVARALGFPAGVQDAWSKQLDRWSSQPLEADADGPTPLVRELVNELVPLNAPRHLGIHSGGMVICDRPVVEVCPVEWARMPGRSVLQWDKDDCEYAGLVKFDLLGLGMLRALRFSFELISSWHGITLELATIPPEQKCVYDMLAVADTVGVFQVESRAQMQALPRTLPGCFYDLAIQVGLIRPGPIQGGAVHPYIRRKHGDEAITYPHPSLEPALKRTLGVPLFQEQLMEIAVYGAGFSPAEADQLRRAMGSKRGVERIDAMEGRLRQGLDDNGITGQVAEDIVNRIKAFAAFGFAESHALSFALLVYASSWLKRHHPAAFLAALLNAQPMGFYSPQSLVHDAKRHGVTVRRADVQVSEVGASLEVSGGDDVVPCGCAHGVAQPAVRLGLAEVRSFDDLTAGRVVAAREAGGPFRSVSDLARRADLAARNVEMLASAGALEGLGLERREALWVAGPASAVKQGHLDLELVDESAVPTLPPMTGTEQLVADFWTTGVTTDVYPTETFRDRLDELGIIPAAQLRSTPDRSQVVVGGIVTHRQRPTTGGGTVFLSLEDETGMTNVICREAVWNRDRKVAAGSSGLLIRGRLERTGTVANVLAESIEKLPIPLNPTSRDFR